MKYRPMNPKMYIGVDISNTALDEAKRRFSQGRFRYKADFIEGNLLMSSTFDDIRNSIEKNGGFPSNNSVDLITIQLAFHYIASSEESTRSLLTQVASFLKKDGGRLLLTIPDSETIVKRMETMHEKQGENQLSFGNSLYHVAFSINSLTDILPGLENTSVDQEQLENTLKSIDYEDVQRAVDSTWGIPYKFYLLDAIDNQEEYIVPRLALIEVTCPSETSISVL